MHASQKEEDRIGIENEGGNLAGMKTETASLSDWEDADFRILVQTIGYQCSSQKSFLERFNQLAAAASRPQRTRAEIRARLEKDMRKFFQLRNSKKLFSYNSYTSYAGEP